jgi:hypothetical protein
MIQTAVRAATPLAVPPTITLIAERAERNFVVATLVYDSWQAAGGEGRRGVLADGRQLAFCTDAVDIALTLRLQANHTFSVAGQLFPARGRKDAYTVELVGDLVKTGECREVTSADDLGEFWIEGVRPGAYHLLLTTPELGILVTPVELAELAA